MQVPLALAAVIKPNSAALLLINPCSDRSHTHSLQQPGRQQKNVFKLERKKWKGGNKFTL